MMKPGFHFIKLIMRSQGVLTLAPDKPVSEIPADLYALASMTPARMIIEPGPRLDLAGELFLRLYSAQTLPVKPSVPASRANVAAVVDACMREESFAHLASECRRNMALSRYVAEALSANFDWFLRRDRLEEERQSRQGQGRGRQEKEHQGQGQGGGRQEQGDGQGHGQGQGRQEQGDGQGQGQARGRQEQEHQGQGHGQGQGRQEQGDGQGQGHGRGRQEQGDGQGHGQGQGQGEDQVSLADALNSMSDGVAISIRDAMEGVLRRVESYKDAMRAAGVSAGSADLDINIDEVVDAADTLKESRLDIIELLGRMYQVVDGDWHPNPDALALAPTHDPVMLRLIDRVLLSDDSPPLLRAVKTIDFLNGRLLGLVRQPRMHNGPFIMGLDESTSLSRYAPLVKAVGYAIATAAMRDGREFAAYAWGSLWPKRVLTGDSSPADVIKWLADFAGYNSTYLQPFIAEAAKYVADHGGDADVLIVTDAEIADDDERLEDIKSRVAAIREGGSRLFGILFNTEENVEEDCYNQKFVANVVLDDYVIIPPDYFLESSEVVAEAVARWLARRVSGYYDLPRGGKEV